MVVGWRNWPRNAGREVSVDETILAFEAEFDVETGELKWINFHDRNLSQLFAWRKEPARESIRSGLLHSRVWFYCCSSREAYFSQDGFQHWS